MTAQEKALIEFAKTVLRMMASGDRWDNTMLIDIADIACKRKLAKVNVDTEEFRSVFE